MVPNIFSENFQLEGAQSCLQTQFDSKTEARAMSDICILANITAIIPLLNNRKGTDPGANWRFHRKKNHPKLINSGFSPVITKKVSFSGNHSVGTPSNGTPTQSSA